MLFSTQNLWTETFLLKQTFVKILRCHISFFIMCHFCPVGFHLAHLKVFFALPVLVYGPRLFLLKLALCHELSRGKATQTLGRIFRCLNVLLFVHGGVVHVTYFMTCWTAFDLYFNFCFCYFCFCSQTIRKFIHSLYF